MQQLQIVRQIEFQKIQAGLSPLQSIATLVQASDMFEDENN
jgi:hypothetical protein